MYNHAVFNSQGLLLDEHANKFELLKRLQNVVETCDVKV